METKKTENELDRFLAVKPLDDQPFFKLNILLRIHFGS